MKITVITSDPECVGDLLREYEDKLLCCIGGLHVYIPECAWLHPTTRMKEFLRDIRNSTREGRSVNIATWDELTMRIVLDAAAKGAELEVRYYREGVDEPVVLKADEHGTLPSWPAKDGFFTQRRKVLFGDDEP